MSNSQRAIAAMKGTAKQIIPFNKLARGSTVSPVGKRASRVIGKRGK